MSPEESQGFTIRDRRGRGEDGETSESTSFVRPTDRSSAGPSKAAQESVPEDEPRPPVTFSSFIFSLGTSALMLMGEQLDPQQGRTPVNLPQAKEIIDILSMLEDKTKNNLTADEQAVLTDMLYALRMKYVDLAGKQTTTSR
jgi:Domain of unknown function (DUF1844)